MATGQQAFLNFVSQEKDTPLVIPFPLSQPSEIDVIAYNYEVISMHEALHIFA